jgi:hypothetical protein
MTLDGRIPRRFTARVGAPISLLRIATILGSRRETCGIFGHLAPNGHRPTQTRRVSRDKLIDKMRSLGYPSH